MMPASYEKFLKEGDQLVNQGKTAEALARYSEARNMVPFRAEARKQILRVALKDENFTTAFEEYLSWAEALHTQGKLDEAIKILLECISLPGQYEKRSFLTERRTTNIAQVKEHFSRFAAPFYELLGTLYAEKKDFAKAIEFFEKAIELSSQNAKLYVSLGLAYLAKGLSDKAKGAFQEVIRLQGPESATAYEKLAEIYSEQGNSAQMVVWLKDAAEVYEKYENFEEAAKTLEKVLALEPSSPEALSRLGEVYSKLGNKGEAIRIYKELADICSRSGLFDKVIALYEKLAELEPENEDMVHRIVEIYRQSLQVDSGNLQARLKLIENLLRLGSVDEIVSEYLKLIENYISMGLSEEAIHCCEKVLAFEPANLQAREFLTELYTQAGKPDEAGRELSKLHLSLAQDFLRQNAPEEATREYRQVLAQYPKHPEALWHVGVAAFAKKDLNEAEAMFERLLSLEKTRLDVQEKLVEIYEAQLLREMEEFNIVAG